MDPNEFWYQVLRPAPTDIQKAYAALFQHLKESPIVKASMGWTLDDLQPPSPLWPTPTTGDILIVSGGTGYVVNPEPAEPLITPDAAAELEAWFAR